MSGCLRVGVVVDGHEVPQWQARWLDRIVSEPGVEIALVLSSLLPSLPVEESGPLSWLRRLDASLHRGFAARFSLVRWTPPAGARRIDAIPTRDERGTIRFAVQEWTAINDAHLDVLLRLDGEPLAAEIAKSTRAGLWSLAVGGYLDHGRSWSALGELAKGRDSLDAELRVALPDGRLLTAARSRMRTHEYSPQRTRSLASGSAPGLVLTALRRLRDRGLEAIIAGAESAVEGDNGTPAALSAALRYGTRIAKKIANRSLFDIYHWTLAIAPRDPSRSVVDDLKHAAFRPIPLPVDEFWADPMLIEHDGETWLFFEIYRYRTGLGLLAASRIDEHGTVEPPLKVLECDGHLSYPFVFPHQGEIYLIPESADRGVVELYRCTRFPDSWELDTVLLNDTRGVDPTLLIEDGRFWLFVGGDFGVGPGETDLHLHVADDLRGPYRPHPQNPIVRDAARARPGGRLLRIDGSLVRPSQDCTGRYGRALSFSRIERMTTEEYVERAYAYVGPADTSWARSALGIHTVDATSRWIVADKVESRFRGPRWWKRLTQRRGSGLDQALAAERRGGRP